MAFSRLRLLGFLPLVLLASGCGGASSVNGNVTLDGTPVEAGYVNFVPADASGSGGRAPIIKGRYAVDSTAQLKPGAYRVEIYARRKTGRQIAAGSPAPPGTMIDEEAEAIPEKYNKQSTLQRELKSGNNPVDFDLTAGR